ncbi:MAG: SGNH/GDSL hydrolase family protein [Planctomycetes bacterium]|nr:SGNH/GDSL hydrolase family protein [Planctomycetota bacterium]
MSSIKNILNSRLLGAALVLAGLNIYWETTKPPRTLVQELDGYLRARMIPNTDGWDSFLTIPEHVNSYGFRGGEWNLQKTPATTRIAVTGSSMTWGSSVAVEKIYTTLLEEKLKESGLKVEVFNCAVQGYTLEQSVRNYEKHVSKFKPDYLIQAFADQDIKDFEIVGTPPKGDLRPWLARTAFYQNFYFEWRPWVRKTAPENPTPSWISDANRKKQENINNILQTNPFAPEMMPMWKAAEERMQRLYDMVRADGGKLIITVLPQPPQAIDPRFEGPERIWRAFAENHKDGCFYIDCIEALRVALDPIRERLAQIQDPGQRGALIINYKNADERHVYHGDKGGHFNEKGMRVIADALAPQVAEILRNK